MAMSVCLYIQLNFIFNTIYIYIYMRVCVCLSTKNKIYTK